MSLKRNFEVFTEEAQSQFSKRFRAEDSASKQQQDAIQQESDRGMALGCGPSAARTAIAAMWSDRAERDATVKSHHNAAPRASLLGISSEIRHLIYIYLFPSIVPLGKTPTWLAIDPPETAVDTQLERASMFCLGDIPVSRVWWYYQRQKHRYAPLQVNRQIRREAFPVFLKDGYFHSWERSSAMPATTAWLYNLDPEQLQLVRALSINQPGVYDPFSYYE